MVTRMYPFDVTVATRISPTFSAGWDGTGSAIRCNMATTTAVTGPGPYTVAGSTSANDDHLYAQHIFGPIAAQTISGTLRGQLMVREENALVDARAQMRAYVVSGDGATVRGVLIEMNTDALATEYGTVYANRRFPHTPVSLTVSSVVAYAGDYIVIEQGFRQHGTNSTGSRISASVATDPDLPADETETTLSRSWFEFSQDLILWRPLRGVVATDLGVAVG